ncbi:unnamed protein product, partial [Polarella glacialis]
DPGGQDAGGKTPALPPGVSTFKVRDLLAQLGVANRRGSEALAGITKVADLVSKQQLWMESMPKSEEHSMWKIMVGDVAKSCTEMQSGIERQALSSEGQEELNWRVKADEASNEVSIFTAKMVGKDNEIDKRKEDIHKAQIKLEAAEEK